MSSLLEVPTEEVEVNEYLSSFLCEKNKDVESFLHNNAIENEKRSFTRTFIVIDEEKQDEIIGYFTLLVKEFSFLNGVSGTKRKILTNNKRAEVFNSLLIAQLGRSDNYKGVIAGEEILNFALHHCEIIYNLVALSIVCVEFDPIDRLIEFYESQDFTILQQNPETHKLLAYIKL
ncbi:hypothetical protein [Bacillus sp. CECT 9360]|uniref:hypothetical protein n=1 Tax=Bacillus sp. CECT 9360 TaxID=2845821 RepID=UPI001E2865E8|nr:hypothetical protein [Bacillus sp. CECT 9360]